MPNHLCDRCGLQFPSAEGYLAHVRTSGRHIVCSTCNADLESDTAHYRHVREVAASWLSSRHESIDQLGLDEYHRAHFGERGLNRHLHRSYVQASTNTRHNQDAVVIEGLSSDEELGEAADSDSEHSFLEGNVSNAASDSSEINTSSDEEAHVISRLPHRRQSVIVISDESEDEDDIEDESNAGSDSGDERAVTSQASSSDVDASDSDSGYSDLSCGSGAMSVVEEEEEVDASANSSAKFTCPICQEEKSNLSCGKCGHVFCTLCIKRALKYRQRCPICRKRMKQTQLRRLFFAI